MGRDVATRVERHRSHSLLRRQKVRRKSGISTDLEKSISCVEQGQSKKKGVGFATIVKLRQLSPSAKERVRRRQKILRREAAVCASTAVRIVLQQTN